MKNVRVAFIGLGGRGKGLLRQILLVDGVRITALCDVYEDRIKEGLKIASKKGNRDIFTSVSYEDILKRDDVDAVIISTSWQSHVKIACDSMRRGIYTAMEVGGTYDINDCYELVKTYEETGTEFMFLENCCYGEKELMCLRMAREGKFGDILQCDGAYCHDLRNEVSFGRENRHYRLEHYLNHNCENYPTHDLGPIAKILNINRGNRMVRLISVPTKALGLHQYVLEKKKDDEVLKNAEFKQADIVTTLIECENGEIIRLTLETTLPRNYSRGFSVHGTKGMYQEDGDIVFLDGKYPLSKTGFYDTHPEKLYGNSKKYAKKYAGDMWQINKKMRKMGHGGMDWLVLSAMVYSAGNRTPSPIDVYDAASWMCITALSEKSIQNGCQWVEIPDFTNGKYKDMKTKDSGPYTLR